VLRETRQALNMSSRVFAFKLSLARRRVLDAALISMRRRHAWPG
jgi:hypothetical protein